MNPLEQFKSILCDPSGKCCISGPAEDRAIVDRALKTLAEPTAPSTAGEPEEKKHAFVLWAEYESKIESLTNEVAFHKGLTAKALMTPPVTREITRLKSIIDDMELAADALKLAQPAQGELATIAGLEASIGHLSSLVNQQLILLSDVNDTCGLDGYGGELEDGESEIIDRVRAHLAAMEPPARDTKAIVQQSAALLQSTPDHIPDAGKMVDARPVGELTPLQKRATDLREKSGMPWSEAEKLALNEHGIGDSDIEELIHQHASTILIEFSSNWEDLQEYTRALLVHAVAHPQASEPVGINGLTEAETSASMSVLGLSKPTEPAPSTAGERAEYLTLSAIRAIAVEAIRAVTGCPDIKGNGKYLVDEIDDVAKHAALLQYTPDTRPVGELTDEQIRSIAESVGEEMWPDNGDVGWTDEDAKFHRMFFVRALAAARSQSVTDND